MLDRAYEAIERRHDAQYDRQAGTPPLIQAAMARVHVLPDRPNTDRIVVAWAPWSGHAVCPRCQTRLVAQPGPSAPHCLCGYVELALAFFPEDP